MIRTTVAVLITALLSIVILSLALELVAGRVAGLVLAGIISGTIYTVAALRAKTSSAQLLIIAIIASILGSIAYTTTRFIAYGAYTEKATSITLTEFLTMAVKSGVFFAILTTSLLFIAIPFLAATAATILLLGTD